MQKGKLVSEKVEAKIGAGLKKAFLRKLNGRSQKNVITDLIKRFVKS